MPNRFRSKPIYHFLRNRQNHIDSFNSLFLEVNIYFLIRKDMTCYFLYEYMCLSSSMKINIILIEHFINGQMSINLSFQSDN